MVLVENLSIRTKSTLLYNNKTAVRLDQWSMREKLCFKNINPVCVTLQYYAQWLALWHSCDPYAAINNINPTSWEYAGLCCPMFLLPSHTCTELSQRSLLADMKNCGTCHTVGLFMWLLVDWRPLLQVDLNMRDFWYTADVEVSEGTEELQCVSGKTYR